ncbi:hypothetical protein [Vibrio sp. MA40-2]|uniref:hypothetical protein n=1 Tax=Vibrio sp. MA40-2 TaxID=3391828 RepID=UPI0039A5E32B
MMTLCLNFLIIRLVANIAPYLEQLQHQPNKVLSLPGGEGFAEWVDDMLSDSHDSN